MILYGSEEATTERTDRGDDKEESETATARRNLADYRALIEEGAAAGHLSFIDAESCRGIADAIEALYDSYDASKNSEASAQAGAEGVVRSDPRDSEGVEVEGDEVESSEAVRAPARNRSGGSTLNATDFPNLSHR